MDVDSFGHFAPDCSSWGVPSRGTSLRNYINAAGNIGNSWVKGANVQVSRNLSSYIRYCLKTYAGIYLTRDFDL